MKKREQYNYALHQRGNERSQLMVESRDDSLYCVHCAVQSQNQGELEEMTTVVCYWKYP